jgi:hypothetical protein
VFKDPEEKCLYLLCCAGYDTLRDREEKKSALCNRLMFFNLSLYENECILGKDEMFTTLLKQFHERWAIENGFKAVKYSFYVKTNVRGACARHARWILSFLYYNAWHYWLLVRSSRFYKRRNPAWKPFDNSTSPPIRKKYERKLQPILTAQGYLFEELGRGMKERIKKVLHTLL